MKVFQILQNFKSGPNLAGAGYQPDLSKRLDFGRSRSQSRSPVQPYFIAYYIWQKNTCSVVICSLDHEKLVSCAAEPTDTRTAAPLTPRYKPRMPCVLKIDLRAPAMPPVCSCWCPTAISSFARAWRWVFTYSLFATTLNKITRVTWWFSSVVVKASDLRVWFLAVLCRVSTWMGDLVTCYLTQVNTPHLKPSQTGRNYSILPTPEGWKVELTQVTTYRDGLLDWGQVNHLGM